MFYAATKLFYFGLEGGNTRLLSIQSYANSPMQKWKAKKTTQVLALLFCLCGVSEHAFFDPTNSSATQRCLAADMFADFLISRDHLLLLLLT